jgi:hypothetical protein
MENNKNNSLNKKDVKEILKDVEQVSNQPHKPEFVNPGYPNFENISKKCTSHEEYSDNVDKFKDKYSVQESLKSFDEECKREVVER